MANKPFYFRKERSIYVKMKLIIQNNSINKGYCSIANAGSINVSCPAEYYLQFLADISGKTIALVPDDWDGTLADLIKQNQPSLIDRIKKYNPFRRK